MKIMLKFHVSVSGYLNFVTLLSRLSEDVTILEINSCSRDVRIFAALDVILVMKILTQAITDFIDFNRFHGISHINIPYVII